MTDYEYYEKQLKQLTNLDYVNIKLHDYDGNTTKYLSLNKDSILALVEFFEKFLKQKGE